jgi:hypothetical protein
MPFPITGERSSVFNPEPKKKEKENNYHMK